MILPDELKKVINFDGAKYKIGIGGLHSQEKKQAIVPTADQLLFEKDVTSYYPNVIVGQNLYPKHLGKSFIKMYRLLNSSALSNTFSNSLNVHKNPVITTKSKGSVG